ncbi:uncharacterized protein K452DRAFT_4928 [Aplosporella prunicola CBS 121167]|uniref:Uncharacterized protein n=1 Tax=Aplosporella prunicola CBS 121167 TaxID=1176127 RepID=A0A6A6BT39_9PEZI|nr:uncharacterized protein K452DRAFT_4928 [Aplosporella prunicola CBS 121167]KAF2147289.1 hypothetical protein K452DRAFT_4928 [Aplosporella prunicola CBS 121167]
MASSAAVRFIAAKGAKGSLGSISLSCHVKPGASAKREGINDLTPDCIELCVSAQAKEGEANKAVQKLIAEVLGVPKSDVEVAKGMKSRDKTVMVYNMSKNKSPEEHVLFTRNALQAAIQD